MGEIQAAATPKTAFVGDAALGWSARFEPRPALRTVRRSNIPCQPKQQVFHFLRWNAQTRRNVVFTDPLFPELGQDHLPNPRTFRRKAIRFIRAVFAVDLNTVRSILPVSKQIE